MSVIDVLEQTGLYLIAISGVIFGITQIIVRLRSTK